MAVCYTSIMSILKTNSATLAAIAVAGIANVVTSCSPPSPPYVKIITDVQSDNKSKVIPAMILKPDTVASVKIDGLYSAEYVAHSVPTTITTINKVGAIDPEEKFTYEGNFRDIKTGKKKSFGPFPVDGSSQVVPLSNRKKLLMKATVVKQNGKPR